ncbi:zf-HC2 domain-containing protein [Bacillus sp. N9]
MNKDCYIVEDLLALYHDGLLQDETVSWVDEHLKRCDHCQEIAQFSKEPIHPEHIQSTVNHDQMMAKIKLRLSIYQIIFVSISFLFAIKTSLLNNSFGFMLSYAILGMITYFFIKASRLSLQLLFAQFYLVFN